MSIEELKKNIYFDYDIEAKLYIMDKYKFKEDIASIILELLYYISEASIWKIRCSPFSMENSL